MTAARGLRERLAGTPATLAVRVLGRGLTFVQAVVLARALGVEEYGVYSFAIAWAIFLRVPALAGLDRLVVRRVAVYESGGEHALLRGVRRRADEVFLLLGALLVSAAVVGGVWLVEPEFLPAFLLALTLIPLRGLTELRQAGIQGLHHPESSLVPIFLILPASLSGAVLGLEAAGVALDAERAVGVTIGAMAAALLAAAVLRRRFTERVILGVRPRFETREWLRDARPLAIVAVLTAGSGQIGLIALGVLGTASDVGVFQVLLRASELLVIVLAAVNTPLAPRVARFFSLGDRAGMQREVRRGARASLYFSLPLAIILVAAQQPVFLIFGEGFTGEGAAFTVVVIGALFNASMGPVGVVMLMTGHSGDAARGMAVGLAVDLVLCAILIPPLGVMGAAIARTADLLVWNTLLAISTWRRLGVNVTAFGRVGH